MNSTIFNRIISIFKDSKGYITTNEFIKKGFHNIYLKELEQQGIITKVKRGLYKLSDIKPSSDYVEISKIIPDGVICLGSALSFYDLTSFEPSIYEVAILRGKKIILPDSPPIHIYHFSEKRYRTGVEKVMIDGHPVSIYNREKTLCDCVSFRNKVGIDLMKEAIAEYLKSDNKNIPRLLEYSKILNSYEQIKKYMEVLV